MADPPAPAAVGGAADASRPKLDEGTWLPQLVSEMIIKLNIIYLFCFVLFYSSVITPNERRAAR